MGTPKIIKEKEIPKRNYTTAALVIYSMDELARHLNTVPTRGVLPDGTAFPSRYRAISFSLGNSRYAYLLQTEGHPEQIEIGIELHNLQLFDEQDLLDVLSVLPFDLGEVQRFDNGSTWVPVNK